MPNSLQSEPVRDLLDRLFHAAAGDDPRRVRLDQAHPGGFGPTSAREQADAYQEIYIPVSPEAGRLLYSLIRAARPSTVVEFGTSFGISTIHLAAAVRDNGAGRVVSTELNAAKVGPRDREHRRSRPRRLGHDPRRRRPGDPRHHRHPGRVRPPGRLEVPLPPRPPPAEPRLPPGALVIADDAISLAAQMADYLGYVRDPAHGYLSVLFPDPGGLEITCRA